MMDTEELKERIIKRISGIEDISFLEDLDEIIGSAGRVKLNEKMISEIDSSREELKNGSFIDDKLLKKEVRSWLRNR